MCVRVYAPARVYSVLNGVSPRRTVATAMPFKAPPTPKCPKCGKSVYHAEARVVGDISFHKECYKCSKYRPVLFLPSLRYAYIL